MRLRRLVVPLLSLLVVGVASPVAADQPVFHEDPGGVGVQVATSDTPESSSEGRASDPKVTHVGCQYNVQQVAGGSILRGEPQQSRPASSICVLAIRTMRPLQAGVTPEALARQAYRYLPLPPPAIRTNPPSTQDQLVNLAVVLWVDETTWGTRTATASVPGLAVTVTAVPVLVTWRMGDGGQVVCQGPGTPFTPTTAGSGQPATCSYTYRRSSAGQPASRFTVTASTTWRITWTATGSAASGTLPPLSRTSQTALRVAEVQAINTP